MVQMILDVLKIAYVMALLPLLLGAAYTCVFRGRREVSAWYLTGYRLMWAVFAAESILLIRKGKHLPMISRIWGISAAVLGLAAVVVLAGMRIWLVRRQRITNAETRNLSNESNWQEKQGATGGWMKQACRKQWDRYTVIAGLVALGVMLFAMFLVKPLPDATVEYASSAYESDEIYYYDPYTVEDATPQKQVGMRYAPVEIWYAILADWTHIPVVIIVKWMTPVFLIMLFYAAIRQWSFMLFATRREQLLFGLAMVILATGPVYASLPHLGFAMLSNSWNGSTILNCILLPEAVLLMKSILDETCARKRCDMAEPDRKENAKKQWNKADDDAPGKLTWPGSVKTGRMEQAGRMLLLCAVAAASQLMFPRGGIYVAYIVVIFVCIKQAFVLAATEKN